MCFIIQGLTWCNLVYEPDNSSLKLITRSKLDCPTSFSKEVVFWRVYIDAEPFLEVRKCCSFPEPIFKAVYGSIGVRTKLVVICFILGSWTTSKSHAVDSQGKNPPQDDLQPASSKLPKVPVPVLHRPGIGAAFAGFARLSYVQHAGGGQQGQGRWTLSSLWKGKYTEIAKHFLGSQFGQAHWKRNEIE